MTGVRIGSLFSGAGMLDEGVRAVLGGDLAWHAEVDPAACKVLSHRYPQVPNLGDVTDLNWTAVPAVDVLTGGSPCQDVSHAGRRAGMRAGTRSGLWAAMCDAIDILRPALVVWENVRGVLSAEADSALEPCPGCVGDPDDGAVLRALGRVLGDLAGLGYDTRWCGLRAADVGAPHSRFRVFVVAWPATDAGVLDEQRSAVPRSSPVSGLRGVPERPADTVEHPAGVDAGHTVARRSSEAGTVALSRPLHASGPAADAADVGHERHRPTRDRRTRPQNSSRTTPDTESAERQRQEPDHLGARLVATAEPRERPSAIAWGPYELAIRRWERVLGRPAPAPTETAPRGGQRLSPRFVEWLMGWPEGWVTDVPAVTRNDQLKICGNGVVPQQAAAAIRAMLAAAECAA